MVAEEGAAARAPGLEPPQEGGKDVIEAVTVAVIDPGTGLVTARRDAVAMAPKRMTGVVAAIVICEGKMTKAIGTMTVVVIGTMTVAVATTRRMKRAGEKMIRTTRMTTKIDAAMISFENAAFQVLFLDLCT
mmetsp:Transcript_10766/g.12791  ORF Transcript_10766/g.12791 Transcript_10766/m.12791 type:complete len:132 (+) Transcript_10766:294-689(+)